MQDIATIKYAGLSEPGSDGTGVAQPLPLVMTVPLIAGLSAALWMGLSHVVWAVFGL